MTQFSCSQAWYFILKKQIVSTNPVSAIKFHVWITGQGFRDFESNPSQVCAMHVKTGASVHVPNCNTTPTQITLTYTCNTTQANLNTPTNTHTIQNYKSSEYTLTNTSRLQTYTYHYKTVSLHHTTLDRHYKLYMENHTWPRQ